MIVLVETNKKAFRIFFFTLPPPSDFFNGNKKFGVKKKFQFVYNWQLKNRQKQFLHKKNLTNIFVFSQIFYLLSLSFCT